MTKRNKIILTIIAGAVVIGGVVFFVPSQPKQQSNPSSNPPAKTGHSADTHSGSHDEPETDMHGHENPVDAPSDQETQQMYDLAPKAAQAYAHNPLGETAAQRQKRLQPFFTRTSPMPSAPASTPLSREMRILESSWSPEPWPPGEYSIVVYTKATYTDPDTTADDNQTWLVTLVKEGSTWKASTISPYHLSYIPSEVE